VGYILHIDTATAIGSVCLAKDGQEIATVVNEQQKDHAASMIPIIQSILKDAGIRGQDLDAIAVSAGPGSYTGLRVGVATAKGLAYTWEKPLIAISTLQMMAQGMYAITGDENAFYVPMIDARRMEVFTAVYDSSLKIIDTPGAKILEPTTFQEILKEHTVYFFGDGAAKWQQLLPPIEKAHFPTYTISAAHMIPLAAKAYRDSDFADLAYFGPDYLKAFYHPSKK